MDVDIRFSPSVDSSKALMVQSGSWLASETGVEVETTWGGGKTFFSGEGLVATFTGPGDLWMQTRSPADFLGWLIPQLPAQRS
jgi:uncharacterized protein (AIM24 family)